jgi:dienelactone hydrolase
MFEGMEPMEFEHDGTRLRGYAATPADATEPSPAVLVMHSALGIAHGVNEPVARKLAERGYLAISTDMYGAHLEGAPVEEAGGAYAENLADPETQRTRTVAWFDTIAARPDVDDDRIAAVGFCYGGMTVLELARSGADLKAAVSYHGILTTHARAEPGAIRGHVVTYCGAGDPYAPPEDVEALHQEMLDAGVRNYQITIFGAAEHGFTDPDSAALQLEGVRYDALSNDLSWSGTLVLLQHVFGR